jgi:hypothetical protein
VPKISAVGFVEKQAAELMFYKPFGYFALLADSQGRKQRFEKYSPSNRLDFFVTFFVKKKSKEYIFWYGHIYQPCIPQANSLHCSSEASSPVITFFLEESFEQEKKE